MDHGLTEDNILAEAMAMLFALLLVISRPWVVSAEIVLDCDPVRLMLQRSAMLPALGPFGEMVVGVITTLRRASRSRSGTRMLTKASLGTNLPIRSLQERL